MQAARSVDSGRDEGTILAFRIRVFFDSWYGLGRVLVVGLSAYAALVCMVRLAGKRSLAKMNAFDLVVTVALGSTLSSIILSHDVALAEGLLAMALLLGLQTLVAWLSSRSGRLERLFTSQASILYRRGSFELETMRAERMTEDDVMAAVRGQGLESMDLVLEVVLESSGDLSVIPQRREVRREPSGTGRRA